MTDSITGARLQQRSPSVCETLASPSDVAAGSTPCISPLSVCLPVSVGLPVPTLMSQPEKIRRDGRETKIKLEV